MYTHTHRFVRAQLSLPFRYAAHSFIHVHSHNLSILASSIYMTGYSVPTLSVRDLQVRSLYILYTPTRMPYTTTYTSKHRHLFLRFAFLSMSGKPFLSFLAVPRVDLIFFKILQKTKTSKIVVKVDMMVFAF